MKYLVKIDRWTSDSFIYVIANNNVELNQITTKLTDDDTVVKITPLNGTIYTVCAWITECDALDK